MHGRVRFLFVVRTSNLCQCGAVGKSSTHNTLDCVFAFLIDGHFDGEFIFQSIDRKCSAGINDVERSQRARYECEFLMVSTCTKLMPKLLSSTLHQPQNNRFFQCIRFDIQH